MTQIGRSGRIPATVLVRTPQPNRRKGIALKDGALEVERDPSAHPWKPASAKWSLASFAGAPPNSHQIQSGTP